MFTVNAGDMVGGMLGMVLTLLLCGGYGHLLVGGVVRPKRGSLLEYAGLCVLFGFSVLSWLGSVLAVASLFFWWSLLASAAVIAVIARRYSRTAVPFFISPTPFPAQVGAVALLVLAGWLFARPTETWLLFDDSAVYAISGVHLAETGTLIPSVETFVCRGWRERGGYDVFRYWGPFRWWTACTPALAIGFLPTPKVWAAISAWLFGQGGAVWSAPVSGLIAMLASFLFMRRAVSAWVALAATALLVVSFPQIWFSRTLMSETFSQIVLFGGLYLLLLEREGNTTDKPSLLGMGAASLFGLLSFIRFEALPFVGIVLAAWLVATIGTEPGTKPRWPYSWLPRWLVQAGGASLVALGLSFGVAPHYFLNQLLALVNRETLRLAVLVAIAFAASAAVAHSVGIQTVWSKVYRRVRAQTLLWALAGAWLLVAVLDLWLRGAAYRGVTSWLPMYLSWPGFLLGALGVLLLVRRKPTPEAYALLSLALISALGFALRPFVTLVHPWAIRRLVPFVIPTLALGVGVVYEGAWAGIRHLTARAKLWRWPAGAMLVLCFGVSVALFGRATIPFVAHRELAGLWEQLEELAALYPPNAIVIYDDGPFGMRLPQAMELALGLAAISYFEPPSPQQIERLEAVIASAHADGRRVFMNMMDGDLMWESERFGLQSHAAMAIHAPRVRYERIPPPTAASITPMHFFVDIYEVVPRDELALNQGRTVVIPVGQGSRPFLGQGFYGVETDAHGRTFRWTSAEALIEAPVPIPAQGNSDVTITLDLGGWRPAGAGETIVAVEMLGRTVLNTRVEHIAEPQRFEVVVADALAPGQTSLEIVLRAETWRPADHGMSDPRDLGVILYGLTLTFEDAERQE